MISHISHISKNPKNPNSVIKAIVLTIGRMERNISQVNVTSFNDESIDLWAVRMQTYIKRLDLWEVVEEDDNPLPENPTVAQTKTHKEKKTRRAKAKS